ncbi:MAG: glutamate--tRNA ligase [Candidatus Liptonbacteria bacterium RIFCSPHIGHO2_01_FULL_57_28]|uniref:Glutamate--tRNA ligase n=1 Tax=Candidatus Liptonbacteria bacterium RIFCSPHIGHO2_01_FULL_57_28 TaxID=1798647 RepID=A0A1G2C9T5_9BACT|nr:MAG: glutamate--tRNA ligase [Candidatus Liptonbacteria bacterium RIFCSPHIGHO2_01_FULL_57_28]
MPPKAENKGQKVRVRFPPSPTGSPHLGSLRAALFNWAFARHHNGTFILRIEDTDQERSKPEFEQQMLEALRWLGLDWDEGPYRQSERAKIYAKYLQQLLDEDKAYYCYCTKEELEAQRESMLAEGLPPKYSGRCRLLTEAPAGKEPQVVRFRTPDTELVFKDMVRGTVKFDTALIDDFVIAKSLDSVLYHFAVVVDDEEMQITHVIRGEDHISNTPKHILLQKALGFRVPEFGHLPLILAADRSKLSKRYAETSILEYRKQGYLPQAMVNFLILLGWHPSPEKIADGGTTEREVFTLEELVSVFDLKRVQKAGAIFNEEKLQWLNREHMKRLSVDELEEMLVPLFEARALALGSRERLHEVIEAVRDRMKTLNDFFELADFFFTLPDYSSDLLNWAKAPAGETKEVLESALAALSAVGAWEKEAIVAALEPLVTAKGKGNVLWPVRVALSGKQNSPDPYDIATALGKEETLARLSKAISKIS